MSCLFSNQYGGRPVLKHNKLPIYLTDEFDFYRCIQFNTDLYGKTVSELHNANLRRNTLGNRYSKLFPNKKISYWADSAQTAYAEVKHHNSSNNLLTFWAYDDATSTFPTIANTEPLVIVDGREIGFSEILNKIENNQELSKYEKALIDDISEQNPDCLVYESLRRTYGLNYLFFEKGFKKLSIREVRLRLGDAPGKNHNCIVCAGTSDYDPYLKSYGEYFFPIAKIKMNENYLKTQEYLERQKICFDNSAWTRERSK